MQTSNQIKESVFVCQEPFYESFNVCSAFWVNATFFCRFEILLKVVLNTIAPTPNIAPKDICLRIISLFNLFTTGLPDEFYFNS
jgi:hypothetical protein